MTQLFKQISQDANIKLVFDFDGVLINSRNESVLNAYNTATNQIITKLTDISNYFLELFELNRPHIKSAGELVYLAEWCLLQMNKGKLLGAPKAMNVDEFNTLSHGWNDLKSKEQNFFEMRSKLQTAMELDWFNLHAPFQPIWNFARNISDQILIVTYKNKKAVQDLTNFYNLNIGPSQIFSGDGAKSKLDNFYELSRQFPAKEYYFLDDNVRNLIDLKNNQDNKLNICLLYAEWGYGSTTTLQAAKSHGINVHSQHSFIELVSNGTVDKSSQVFRIEK